MLDLPAAGLKNHIIVYLEQGARPPSDSLLLSLVLVNGNSTETKYTAEEAGQRLQEVEITAHVNDTVESLRERAGCLLLNYAPGWTRRCELLLLGSGVRNHNGEELTLPPAVEENEAVESADIVEPAPLPSPPAVSVPQLTVIAPPKQDRVDPAPEVEPGPKPEPELEVVVVDPRAEALAEFGEGFVGRRLRRTSWLKEFAELTQEIADDIPATKGGKTEGNKQAGRNAPRGAAPVADGPVVPVVVPLTLKEAGFKSGDTLLLEEGVLPIKGQMTIQLYVWRAEPKATDSATTDSESLSVLEAATLQRRACLVPLGSVDVLDRASLDELQSVVHATLNLQGQYLTEQLDDWTGEYILL